MPKQAKTTKKVKELEAAVKMYEAELQQKVKFPF